MLPNEGFASAQIEDVIENVVADDTPVSADAIVAYVSGNRVSFTAAINGSAAARPLDTDDTV